MPSTRLCSRHRNITARQRYLRCEGDSNEAVAPWSDKGCDGEIPGPMGAILVGMDCCNKNGMAWVALTKEVISCVSKSWWVQDQGANLERFPFLVCRCTVLLCPHTVEKQVISVFLLKALIPIRDLISKGLTFKHHHTGI